MKAKTWEDVHCAGGLVMKITPKGYTVELTWAELRDISNALHDALQHRYYHLINVGDKYPECEYKRLQDKINEVL